MIDSKYRISLDIHSTTSNVRLKCKRGDTSRIICATLTENGFPYHISEDCYAVFTAPKPDGNVVFNKCKINDNVIEYEFTPQTAAVSGVMKCEIKLYGADDKLITSPSFVLVVSDTAYDEGDEIESEKEVDALTHLISESTEAIKKAERVPNFGINAKVGQYLKISKVGPDGKVIEVIPVDPPAGGSYGSGDLDMKGCNVERVGSLDFEPSNDDYSQAFWMQAGSDIKNADGSQTAVAEFYSSESDLPVVLRHIANGMQDDDAVNVGQLKTRLLAPIKAAVGQYIRIAAVDENGVVTAVEAFDAPAAGGGTNEVFAKLEDGTVVSAEVEFDFSEDNTPALVVAPPTAEVGQTIVVKAVDENGKPTEWEAVDLPSGGGTKWELITEYTVTDVVNSVTFSEDMNGAPFSLSKMKIFMVLPKYDYEGQEGTGYAQYSINGVYNYEYPSTAWDDGSFIGDIECFGNFCIAEWRKITEGKHGGSSNNWTIFGGIKQIGESGVFDTIHSFEWGVFNRKVLPGSTFKIYGVRV